MPVTAGFGVVPYGHIHGTVEGPNTTLASLMVYPHSIGSLTARILNAI